MVEFAVWMKAAALNWSLMIDIATMVRRLVPLLFERHTIAPDHPFMGRDVPRR